MDTHTGSSAEWCPIATWLNCNGRSCELRKLHARFPGETTPVLIAPELSEEAQALCRESNTGFLDFEGNARLYLDEVFIVKRSLTHHKTLPPPAEPLPTSETARFAEIA